MTVTPHMPRTDSPAAVRPRKPSPSTISPCGFLARNEPEPDEPTVSRLVTVPPAGASTEPVRAVMAGPSVRDSNADPYRPVTPAGTDTPVVR